MLHLQSEGKQQDFNGPVRGDAVVTLDVLYSQYLEAQPFLGSHLDKSSPSGHCEGSGKEGSSFW